MYNLKRTLSNKSQKQEFAHPYVLVHVAGGGEEPVADVALVRSRCIEVDSSTTSSRASGLQHSVNSFHVNVQVARLCVAASTDLALVRSVLAVAPHVSLQQAGHVELPWARRALEGGGEGGRGRDSFLQLLPAACRPGAAAVVVRGRQGGQAGQRDPCWQGQARAQGLQKTKKVIRVVGH